MHLKLFVTCPFSHLQPFLENQFGNQHFFSTAMGTGVHTFDDQSLQAHAELMETQKIQQLYLVQDLDCRFLNTALIAEPFFDLPVVNQLEKISHQLDDQLPARQKAYQLAQLHLNNQIEFLQNHAVFSLFIAQNAVKIGGIVTSKKEQRIEIFQKTAYGLASAD